MAFGNLVLDGKTVALSSTFSGSSYTTILGPTDVSHWSNIVITLVNNGINNLQSGSVEFSADNINWETDWNTSTFSALSASGAPAGSVRSMQIAGNSRAWLRVRAIPAGTLTGSISASLSLNNG